MLKPNAHANANLLRLTSSAIIRRVLLVVISLLPGCCLPSAVTVECKFPEHQAVAAPTSDIQLPAQLGSQSNVS
jgi:hypothetical protein